MDLKLSGRRVLVTGSSSGLGEAMVHLLSAEGARVVVHGRNHERAQTVAAAVLAAGGHADIAVGDLATDEGADAVADAALASGNIDVLVNNAGAYDNLSWTTALPKSWREIYEGNVISGVRMIHRLVPPMRERGWGRVITIGGGMASQPADGHPHYNATLAARHNLAVSLARELSGTGVTSNVVAPGGILVDAIRQALTASAPTRGWGDSWEQIETDAIAQLMPNDVGRFGRPEEIAAAVAYLSSRHADYISGAVIRVDGGAIRSMA